MTHRLTAAALLLALAAGCGDSKPPTTPAPKSAGSGYTKDDLKPSDSKPGKAGERPEGVFE